MVYLGFAFIQQLCIIYSVWLCCVCLHVSTLCACVQMPCVHVCICGVCSVCTCVHMCMYSMCICGVCIHVLWCACVHMCVHVCVVCMQMCMCGVCSVHIVACVYTCVSWCVCTCVHMCMCVCAVVSSCLMAPPHSSHKPGPLLVHRGLQGMLGEAMTVRLTVTSSTAVVSALSSFLPSLPSSLFLLEFAFLPLFYFIFFFALTETRARPSSPFQDLLQTSR